MAVQQGAARRASANATTEASVEQLSCQRSREQHHLQQCELALFIIGLVFEAVEDDLGRRANDDLRTRLGALARTILNRLASDPA